MHTLSIQKHIRKHKCADQIVEIESSKFEIINIDHIFQYLCPCKEYLYT